MSNKLDIKSLLPGEIEDHMESVGERRYRGGQVFRWLHKGVPSFYDMTDLPGGLQRKLDGMFYISSPELLEKLVSKQDTTVKYLWGLRDGNSIESVLMEYNHGSAVCVSTQVGCAMGCAFCASTIGGFRRNLLPSEMLDQVLFSIREIPSGTPNLVLMGIGEPLDNYDNVLKFLKLVNAPGGINIGARHITLSTCGIVEYIDRLSENDIQLSLAVSLHAPDDETRTQLMPINEKYGVGELLAAGERFFRKTGRRVTYEYALIDKVNDSDSHARLLSKKLKSAAAHCNIILLNGVAGNSLKASRASRVKAFLNILSQNSVNYTVRRKLGLDIDAACGQLRAKRESSDGTMGNN